MVKQSKTTSTRKAAKPVPKRANKKVPKKAPARSKVAKKPVKSRVKLAKSTVGKNKQLRKDPKKTPRGVSKTTRKSPAAKSARKKSNKRTKKSQGRFEVIFKKFSKAGYSPRLLLLSAVIAGGLGILCGHQVWAKGYANILGSKQITEAPGRISTVGPAQNSPDFSTYPTWSQNFAADTSGKLDSRYWNVFKGIPQNDNNEAEYYTDNPANIHIKNGALSLVATRQAEPNNYKYASARIDTEKKLSLLYGRVDVTAKVPNDVGAWPAVWFLPDNTKYEDLSPSNDSLRYLNGGELDLIEEVGFNPNTEYGIVHTRSDLNNPDGYGAYDQIDVPNNNVDYNLYSLLWTPTSVTFEVNNNPFFTYNKPAGADYTTWAFDQPFYLVMNLAMGGKWGGEDTADFPGNGINNSALPTSMDIKSIYYYPYTGAR